MGRFGLGEKVERGAHFIYGSCSAEFRPELRIPFSPMMKSLLFAVCLAPFAAVGDEFPTPIDSEKPDTAPMAPAEGGREMRLPPGFKASVFAAEPDVRKPIAMCFDSRGRI